MRIAFFGPLRPVASGISDYCEELLPYLAEGAEISIFVDGYEPTNLFLRRRFPICDYREFPRQHRTRPFDLCLYHMGNHICHAYIYEMLQRYPGVVVLHDTVLHHFLGEYLSRGEGPAAYRAAFPDELGRSLLRRRRAGLWSYLDHFLFPGIAPVVRASRGIIVHSETARKAVLRAV
ncbi:MAG: glycosyl transferase family 1, partial [Chloroflexia bacterium]